MKGVRNQTDMIYKDSDAFLEDIKLFKNLKILRIFENNNLKVDVFLSFDYDENEYFGAYRNFNGLGRPKLESELFYEPEYVLGYNTNTDNKPYIMIKVKDHTYHVENNDYYYFKWRFDKIK